MTKALGQTPAPAQPKVRDVGGGIGVTESGLIVPASEKKSRGGLVLP